MIYVPQNTFAETKTIEFDRNLKSIVTYPNGVVIGEKFTVLFLIENESTGEKQNIQVSLDGQSSFKPLGETNFMIPRLARYGEYGITLDFQVPFNATTGKQFFNLNFTTGTSETFFNTILEISITDEPQVMIRTSTPDSIFTDAEFPFEVEIESRGSDITDVSLQIIPPEDIIFRGEKLHTFSSIQKNNPISIRAQLITTGQGEVDVEHFLPFSIIVSYTDDFGAQKTESKTTSVLLRPRTHFEWGPNAGLWIGDFYLAPTISIGTFVGAPLGVIITLVYKKYKKKPKRKNQ